MARFAFLIVPLFVAVLASPALAEDDLPQICQDKSIWGMYGPHADFETAISAISQCLENELDAGNRAYFHSKRGFAYYRLQEYDLAIDDFNKAIEIAPLKLDKGAYYARRAWAYKGKKDILKAKADVKMALELNPKAGGPKFD